MPRMLSTTQHVAHPGLHSTYILAPAGGALNASTSERAIEKCKRYEPVCFKTREENGRRGMLVPFASKHGRDESMWPRMTSALVWALPWTIYVHWYAGAGA